MFKTYEGLVDAAWPVIAFVVIGTVVFMIIIGAGMLRERRTSGEGVL